MSTRPVSICQHGTNVTVYVCHLCNELERMRLTLLNRAAPDLLAACELALEHMEAWADGADGEDPATQSDLAQVRDAIAKAKGARI